MNKLFSICILWFGLSLLTACNKKNKGQKEQASLEYADEKSNLSGLLSVDHLKKIDMPEALPQNTFNYLTTKSKFSFESGSQHIDNTSMNVRIQKDSIIWLSVTGFGFEVARGLITQDSVRFIDKINKNYYAFSYADLHKKYHFPLNFNLLESLFIGKVPLRDLDQGNWYHGEDFIVFKPESAQMDMDLYFKSDNLDYYQLKTIDRNSQTFFGVEYGEHKQVQDHRFPFSSLISLLGRKSNDNDIFKTTIQIQHTKMETAEVNPGFPFAVPSGYTQKR
jgi:hypothetical protein